MSSLSNYFKEEIDKIEIPQEELDLLVEDTLKRAKKRDKNLYFKVMLFSGVAILLIGLFISSTFVSPAMAKVASKIPLIKLVYHSESESIISIIQSKLKDKGYKVDSVGYSVNPKVIHVHIDGSASYLNEIKDAVKKTTQSILKSKGYNAFSINISNSSKAKDRDNLNQQRSLVETQSAKQISSKLKQLNYPASVAVDSHRRMIDITLNLNVFKGNFKEAKKDIPKHIKTMSEFKEHYSDYDINVMGMKVSTPDPAARVISDLSESLLSKKVYKVTGTGYKNHPLQFMIYTSESSSDPNVKEYSHNLETAIQKYLESDKVSKIFDGKTYKIIIKSKEDTKIN